MTPMGEQYADSRAMETAVAQVLARQMLGNPEINYSTAWRSQTEETKLRLRAEAREILKIIDRVRSWS